MYLSKLTVDLSKASPEVMTEILGKGEYVIHQWLWEVFPQQPRSFLYRKNVIEGAVDLYVLSSTPPLSHSFFEIHTKEFQPNLFIGERLRFRLRANPTICRGGKNHDVLMNKKRCSKTEKGFELSLMCQSQAREWLRTKGQNSGFELLDAKVDKYVQEKFPGKGDRFILFSSVDYSGVLRVTDPDVFLQQMRRGFGRSKAFGCGLMLISLEK